MESWKKNRMGSKKARTATKAREIKHDLNAMEPLSEQDLHLILRRVNNADNPRDVRPHIGEDGVQLTEEQVAKGKAWLMKQYNKSLKNGEITDAATMGWRELNTMDNFVTIKLRDFYDVAHHGQKSYYVPLYQVVGGGEASDFEYYVWGGKINIVG